ncbi:RNA-binding protein-like protein [Leishmania donovani]|uniref:RNA recognition motif family protein n=1 Tax=Leishmania donovani TaxID=5661 RepID=E9BAF5_LEIDO|nr:RNA-binding protein-like protein [Leishmania donovani]TPP46565.1 RNA recognition motif family protein [Leishmania donovani]CBZ32228.1 RNA-binding protein-like protein [Leishmania donovani]
MPPKSTVKKADSAAATGKRKKLSFAESTVKAAAAAIHTTNVNVPVKAAAKHAPLGAAPRRKGQNAKKTTVNTSSAAKQRAATDLKRSGIVKAKRTEEEVAAPPAPSDEENSSDDEDDMLNGGAAVDSDADDLSDMADRAPSDDEDDELGAGKQASSSASRQRDSNGTVEPYRAVRLSFLPPEFQEPQLYKFLNQFGATVLNCFCVRSKRTHRSRGIAYVEFDKESAIPLVVEECNGMALGGKAVRARAVTMRRRMPSRQMVSRRRALAYAYKTQGAPLKKHDVRRKDPVGLLIKAVRTEKDNNNYLESLGIDFKTDFFQSQLATLPPGLLKKKRSRSKKSENNTVAAAGMAKAFIKTTDIVTSAPKSSPKRATRRAPATKTK